MMTMTTTTAAFRVRTTWLFSSRRPRSSLVWRSDPRLTQRRPARPPPSGPSHACQRTPGACNQTKDTPLDAWLRQCHSWRLPARGTPSTLSRCPRSALVWRSDLRLTQRRPARPHQSPATRANVCLGHTLEQKTRPTKHGSVIAALDVYQLHVFPSSTVVVSTAF